MLPLLSRLKQCCQWPRSRRPCFQAYPGLFLDFFVRTPLASYGAIGQKERWTPMAFYGGKRGNPCSAGGILGYHSIIVKITQLCSKFPPTALLNFACDG